LIAHGSLPYKNINGFREKQCPGVNPALPGSILKKILMKKLLKKQVFLYGYLPVF
jgi:hypothetical protein